MSEYKVKFEVFEGPLDLLLYLIKKEEVDIYQVNLTGIATQFIEYIEVMRLLDLEIAGEFLVMAATLMYIKSKELLPVEQRAVTEEDDEGEDPRWELIRQLVEYKKFKDAADQLQVLELRQEETFPRIPGIVKFEPDAITGRAQASLFDLINAVNAVLKRLSGGDLEEAREIYEDQWTVSSKIEFLLKEISEKTVLRFSSLFSAARSRTEVVVTFLAVLELIRLRHLTAVQAETFGEIELSRPAETDLPPIAGPVSALVDSPSSLHEPPAAPAVDAPTS